MYDGHSGATCSEHLKLMLHDYLINEAQFPIYPQEALLQSFIKEEQALINMFLLDKSSNSYIVLAENFRGV